MELNDFNNQNHSIQADLILEQGQYLLSRQLAQFSIVLYDMGKFFAEIWYDMQMKSIQLVRGFNNTEILNPYLDVVDVSRLIP